MDRVFDQRRAFAIKAFSVMAVALLCISILSRTVLADMGPKSSVDITLKNPPSEPYYVALLVPGTYYPDKHYRNVEVLEEDEHIKDIFFNYDEDGFILYCYAGNSCSIKYSGKMTKPEIHYGYNVPSTIKVIIVTRSGDVTVSNELTTKAFHAECEYDYSANTLTEVNFASNFSKHLAVESVFFFGFTIINEGIVLLCFGLFRKKNLLRFILANVITQTLLYVFNVTYCVISSVWISYFGYWLVAEALITGIEILIYCKKLVKKDGTVSIGRNIAYAITANFISAFIDVPLIFIADLIKIDFL
jgi:hypothetical protein